MQVMDLVKQLNGSYLPAYNSDYEESAKVKLGGVVSTIRARNPDFHKKFFALLNLCFANQDQDINFNLFRKKMIVNAGYYDEVVEKDGHVNKFPHSISFDNMDQTTFEKLYSDMLNVVAVKLKTSPDEIKLELINFM